MWVVVFRLEETIWPTPDGVQLGGLETGQDLLCF